MIIANRLFMTLKNSVRCRSTFSDTDTVWTILDNFDGSAPQAAKALGTNRYYAHILNRYPDVDLQAALTVSRIGGAPSKCSMYKEVQIHGAVDLRTDIESISVPGKKRDASVELKKLVEDFQKKTNCNVLWQGDLLGL